MDAYLQQFGEPIRYAYVRERFPIADYQTMFARTPGSSEMPSASRPFTARVVDALAQTGVSIASVTLHCGVASFETPELPATERFAVSAQAARAVNLARPSAPRDCRREVPRCAHSKAPFATAKSLRRRGWTDLVIDRDHTPRTVDGLLTGFHDADATHLWILQAFLDRELLAQAYEQAAALAYYEHEFGDVHLIL